MLTHLRNARLFAPEARGVCDIVVAGERIVWIGGDGGDMDAGGDGVRAGERRGPRRAAVLDLPRALVAETIDLEGRTVVPGFIDGHVHLTGGGGEAGFRTRVPPLGLERYTRGGVTTAIGVLGTDDLVRTPADVVATARGLIEEGLSAWCLTGGYHVPPATITGSVRGDIVHVDRIIGVGEVAVSDHRSSQPTLDELLRLASEAHVAGLMTGKAGVLHLHLGDGPRGLDMVRRALATAEIPPRAYHPTHVNRRKALFEEALDVARAGCTIDVTAFPVAERGGGGAGGGGRGGVAGDVDHLPAHGELGAMDGGDAADEWTAPEAIARYWDAGLPPERLTVSSDGGGCLPVFDADGRVVRMGVGDLGALADTIAVLLAAGWPLERVLPPFTSNVARHWRLPGKGTLVPGADADLVVLDDAGRPMDVMARGIWYVRSGRVERPGTFA
ncbi:MAG: amidohydrolase family protein [Anaerolineae bacterium]